MFAELIYSTMEKIAVFPGSFDPFTVGHEEIVRRGLAVVSLFFQFGKFFFGQRVVAEKGALADIIQITRMNEGFFCERGLFLHSGKFLFGLGEGFVGLGEVLLFLVNLGGQAVQPFLLPLNFELGDGQVFFGAAALAALYIGVPDIVHIVEEIVLQDAVRLLQDWFAVLLQDGLSSIVQQGLGCPAAGVSRGSGQQPVFGTSQLLIRHGLTAG